MSSQQEHIGSTRRVDPALRKLLTSGEDNVILGYADMYYRVEVVSPRMQVYRDDIEQWVELVKGDVFFSPNPILFSPVGADGVWNICDGTCVI